jgi:hypothetical protein
MRDCLQRAGECLCNDAKLLRCGKTERGLPDAEIRCGTARLDARFIHIEVDVDAPAWPEACIDAPGVDRNRLPEYIGSTALKFFDTNLGVPRDHAN